MGILKYRTLPEKTAIFELLEKTVGYLMEQSNIGDRQSAI